MTIEEKYLELLQKSVNPKNDRYLFIYLENRQSRCLKGEVLNISRSTSTMASDTQPTYIICVCFMKTPRDVSESLETVNSGRFDNRSSIFLENNSYMTSQPTLNFRGGGVGLGEGGVSVD